MLWTALPGMSFQLLICIIYYYHFFFLVGLICNVLFLGGDISGDARTSKWSRSDFKTQDGLQTTCVKQECDLSVLVCCLSVYFSCFLSPPLLSPFPSWEYESEEDERGTSSFLCFLLSCQDDGTMTVTPVLQLKCSQNYKPCLMSWLPWHGKTNGVNATKLLSDPALPVIIAVSLLPTNSYWCLKTQLLTNLSCEHHSITDMKMDVGLSLLPCPVELLIGGVIWGCWVWCASSVVLFLKDEIQRPSFSEAVVCLLSFYQTADGAK